MSEYEKAREEERKKLEKEFQKSDAKLDQLVSSGEKNIRSVMEVIVDDSKVDFAQYQFLRFCFFFSICFYIWYIV